MTNLSPGGTELVPPAPAGNPQDEKAVFKIIEKLVGAAAVCSRQNNLKSAASTLRRAYAIASQKADSGLLAGRAARADVSVQYAALLSKFGRHTDALKEALAAAREAEEVWSILENARNLRDTAVRQGKMSAGPQHSPYGILQGPPPDWIEKAVSVLIQAKQCVAIELEFSIAGHSEESLCFPGPGGAGGTEDAETVRDQLIPSLHKEAADLASRLLPAGHPMRKLALRAQTQAVARQHAEAEVFANYGNHNHNNHNHNNYKNNNYHNYNNYRDNSNNHNNDNNDNNGPVSSDLEDKELEHHSAVQLDVWIADQLDAWPASKAVYGAPLPLLPGGPGGSRPTSAASRCGTNSRPTSAVSRPASAARVEVQGAVAAKGPSRPSDIELPEFLQEKLQLLGIPGRPSWVEPGYTSDSRRSASSPLLPASTSSRARTQIGRSSSKDSKGMSPSAASGFQKDEERGPPKNIFQEWVQGDKKQKAMMARMQSEEGVNNLKRGLRQESCQLKRDVLPFQRPEHIFFNRIMYSASGLNILKSKLGPQSRPTSSGGAGGVPDSIETPLVFVESKADANRHFGVLIKDVKNMSRVLTGKDGPGKNRAKDYAAGRRSRGNTMAGGLQDRLQQQQEQQDQLEQQLQQRLQQ
ncbi:unnamed protein product [Polarella glacialis]|uniref:Uncharacterized protein n=1 Tax=Polarella glacialis TaxID=89957 RepID=A0A813DTD4_POLGL|nr:unnamed protein product [Polarella glacialis]